MDPRLLPLALLAVVVAGCGGADARPAQAPARVVSVGEPVHPHHVPIQRGGSLEMRAPGVGGSPAVRLAVLHAPGADPRDNCLAVLQAGALFTEADARCDVRVRAAPTVFVLRPGEGAPIVVAGIAPPGIARVRVSGPGGRRLLPLSRHRAFMAVYAVGTRGPVRLTADGRRVDAFVLGSRIRLPRHRRPGAVFDDEVGESILQSSRGEILRRFGPPAARRAGGCLVYEVVGEGRGGWTFCFAGDGRMVSARHSS